MKKFILILCMVLVACAAVIGLVVSRMPEVNKEPEPEPEPESEPEPIIVKPNE